MTVGQIFWFWHNLAILIISCSILMIQTWFWRFESSKCMVKSAYCLESWKFLWIEISFFKMNRHFFQDCISVSNFWTGDQYHGGHKKAYSLCYVCWFNSLSSMVLNLLSGEMLIWNGNNMVISTKSFRCFGIKILAHDFITIDIDSADKFWVVYGQILQHCDEIKIFFIYCKKSHSEIYQSFLRFITVFTPYNGFVVLMLEI